MAAYQITTHACDATLTIPVELTPEEAAIVKRVALLTDQASDHGCEPYMTVTAPGEAIPFDE